ncbi:MAG: 3-ketoacyl-CoA thiolase @ Acetyl-CoA acetyltransferase, partial [uncultured Corynebacteriales bacterium]
ARGRHRRDRPFPDRPRRQGVDDRVPPGRPGRHHRPDRPGQGPAARPGRARRPDGRRGPARRRAGLQPGPGGVRAARPGPAARHHGHPLLRVLAADDPDGVPRDQGRRGARVRRRRGGDGQPVPPGQLRQLAGHDQRGLPAGRGAHPDRRGGRGGVARPARRRRGAGHLHRDGPDRGEPRPAQGRVAGGDGRLRGPLAEPGREGDRRRLLGAGDHPGHRSGRHRDQQGRRPPGRRDAGGRGRPEAGVPAGRAGHRRQLLPAQRRRGRGRGDVRRAGPRARDHAAGPDRLHRGVRAVPGDHGPRPGRVLPARARAGRDVDRGHRPGRDERGVRGPGHPVLPGPRHRPRPAERQRRRDRRRPPVRDDRRPHRHHAGQLAPVARQDARPGDHVRRRRPGHGHGPGAPEL